MSDKKKYINIKRLNQCFWTLGLITLMSSACSKNTLDSCQKITNFQFENIPKCESYDELGLLNSSLKPEATTALWGDESLIIVEKLKIYNRDTGLRKSTLKNIFTKKNALGAKYNIYFLNQRIIARSFIGNINSMDYCPVRSMVQFSVQDLPEVMFKDEADKYKHLFTSSSLVFWVGGFESNVALSVISGCNYFKSYVNEIKIGNDQLKKILLKMNHPLKDAIFVENLSDEKINYEIQKHF